MDKYTVGIDISLTDTGLVVLQNMDGDYAWQVKLAQSCPSSKDQPDYFRKHQIIGQVIEGVLRNTEPRNTVVLIEDYAYGRATGKSFTRAEIGGAIKWVLATHGYTVFTASSTAIKKYMIHGKADKPDMKTAAQRTFGFVHRNDNVVDAFCCARYLIDNRRGLRLTVNERALPLPRLEILYAPIRKDLKKPLLRPLTKKIKRHNLLKATAGSRS